MYEPSLKGVPIDIVLRRSRRLLPEATLRAFADDIAVVVPDVAKALPILSNIFEELGNITGLFLNKPKCVLIPLWPTDVDAAKLQIAQHFPFWADLDVKMFGT